MNPTVNIFATAFKVMVICARLGQHEQAGKRGWLIAVAAYKYEKGINIFIMMISTGLHCIKRLWNIYSRHILQLLSLFRPYQALFSIFIKCRRRWTSPESSAEDWSDYLAFPGTTKNAALRTFTGLKKPLLWFSTSRSPWFPRNFFHVHIKFTSRLFQFVTTWCQVVMMM